MSDAPLSSDLRGRYQSSWTWLKAPQGHHQWPPPPSCPWPITQNITINSCPGAKHHRHSRAYSYMLCTDSPCKDSFVRGQKVEVYNCILHATLNLLWCFYVLWLGALPVERAPTRCINYCAIFEADEKCARQCVNCFITCHKPACAMSFTHLTNHAVLRCPSPCENWRINRGLREKTTHTWCYGNDGLSLFVCTSEEQAQIINECFASSV